MTLTNTLLTLYAILITAWALICMFALHKVTSSLNECEKVLQFTQNLLDKEREKWRTFNK